MTVDELVELSAIDDDDDDEDNENVISLNKIKAELSHSVLEDVDKLTNDGKLIQENKLLKFNHKKITLLLTLVIFLWTYIQHDFICL